MLKNAWKKWGPNPFERLLQGAKKKEERRFLISWNRGLGDVALGLYALVFRIREVIPDAHITFLTRPDLEEGFKLLEGVHVLTAPTWQRGISYNLNATLESLGKNSADFDLTIEKPDPTHWVRWQLGTLVPKLQWQQEWDTLPSDFPLSSVEKYIGIQPQTETQYGYEKNWPIAHWRELIEILTLKTGMKIVLFGKNPDLSFSSEKIIDLRGKTTLLQMLSVIK
ncbi:MAG: glycosyltransferase family 9 protein, partial [Chlamydiales bacterium]